MLPEYAVTLDRGVTGARRQEPADGTGSTLLRPLAGSYVRPECSVQPAVCRCVCQRDLGETLGGDGLLTPTSSDCPWTTPPENRND